MASIAFSFRLPAAGYQQQHSGPSATSGWKLKAGSWKLSSYLLRKRIAKSVEYEIAEEEEGDRDGAEHE